MKKSLCLIISLMLALSAAITSYALELETVGEIPAEEIPADEVVENETVETESEIPNDETVTETPVETESEVSSSENTEENFVENTEEVNPDLSPVVGEDVLTGISVYSVSPIESADTSGLKAILIDLFGTYDAIIVEYEYTNSNSNYPSYLREIQPDYVWLCSCGIFALVLYCVFKFAGGVFKRG